MLEAPRYDWWVTPRALVWTLLPVLTFAEQALADVSPPRHDPTCTVSEQARFPGQCIECCMGDGCPHPELRCPAEEGFYQRCVRYSDPPYSAPTYAVWCDPNARPSGIWALIALARVPALWVGMGTLAMAGGFAVFLVHRKSRRRQSS